MWRSKKLLTTLKDNNMLQKNNYRSQHVTTIRLFHYLTFDIEISWGEIFLPFFYRLRYRNRACNYFGSN